MAAFNADFSWAKGSFGRQCTWIGASFTVHLVDGLPGVTLKLAEGKFKEMVGTIEELLQLQGIIRTVYDNEVKRASTKPKHLMFLVRIQHALVWISAVLRGRPPGRLFFGCAVGVRLKLFNLQFKACRGDSTWQAEWEFYCILIAADLWSDQLRRAGLCSIQADATAALHAVHKLKGRSLSMNAMPAEPATQHVPAALNVEAEALSRLSEGCACPPALQSVAKVPAPCRTAEWLKAWPKELAHVSA
eukprot:4825796-Amphidinium_carterae.3